MDTDQVPVDLTSIPWKCTFARLEEERQRVLSHQIARLCRELRGES